MTRDDRSAPPIDYASRNIRRRFRMPRFSIVAFLAFACPIFTLYLFIELFIPRLETMYWDLGIKLPRSTQIMLDIARAGYQYNYLPAVCVPLAASFLAPLLTTSRPHLKRRPWIILLLILNAVLLLMLLIAIVVLVDPFFTMIPHLLPK